MQSEMRAALNLILKEFTELDYVHPEDIPNIDLYVDQVTTFIESQLSSMKRNEDEKILTKTMINNYTKNHVLPSPDKKKYSRDFDLLSEKLFIHQGYSDIIRTCDRKIFRNGIGTIVL